MKKKQILLGMLVLLLAFSLGFFSCDTGNGGDDVKPDINEPDKNPNLPGTTWEFKMTKAEYVAEMAAEMDMDEAFVELLLPPDITWPFVILKLEFTSGRWKITEIAPKDGEEDSEEGTYTVDGNGTITFTEDTGNPGEYTGTVSGNKLTLTDEDGEEIVLTKK